MRYERWSNWANPDCDTSVHKQSKHQQQTHNVSFHKAYLLNNNNNGSNSNSQNDNQSSNVQNNSNNINTQQNVQNAKSQQEIRSIVAQAISTPEQNINFVKIKPEYEDDYAVQNNGVPLYVYEIEARANGLEYDLKVDAVSGKVLKVEIDN